MDPRSGRSLPCGFVALILLLALGAASPANAVNTVGNVVMSPSSPAALEWNTPINITFDYEVDEPGALIFFRPFTSGDLTPSYSAHGSASYPVGTGSDTAYFTITSGMPLVDHVRVQIVNAAQSAVLYEAFLPVFYHFGEYGTVTNIQFTPPSPASVALDALVNIAFDYQSTQDSGIRIFFRPFTGGAISPHAGTAGSPLYAAGSGSGTFYFTIQSEPALVDEMRLTVTDPDQGVTYHEFRFPVSYTFHSTRVEPVTWGRLKSLYEAGR